HPGMPGAADLAAGRVLVEKVALVDARLRTEVEELACDVLVAGAVERVGHDGAVPRPDIGVRVARELRDVEVGGGHDAAAVVDVAAGGERAAPVEAAGLGAELLFDVLVLLVRPDLPVGPGARA